MDRISRGLCKRAGLERRGDGAGDPLRSDCNARQVPNRPLPEWTSSSDGGGVESKRLAAKRDGRRTSQGSADGSNMLRSNRLLYQSSNGRQNIER